MTAVPPANRQPAHRQSAIPSAGVLRASLLPVYRPLRASTVSELAEASSRPTTDGATTQIARKSHNQQRLHYYASAAYTLPGYASPQVRLVRSEDAGWLSNSFLQRRSSAIIQVILGSTHERLRSVYPLRSKQPNAHRHDANQDCI